MADKTYRIVVPSSVTPRMSSDDDKTQKIRKWDDDNKYPSRVENAIASSGTATACSKKYAKFLRGQGYRNPELENLVVNAKGETLGNLHKLICRTRSIFEGYAFAIGYNALLEVTSIEHVPLKFIRFEAPEQQGGPIIRLKINDDWACEIRKEHRNEDISIVDLYTEDRTAILKQIETAGGFDKWKGHIVFFSERGNLMYPTAVCDSVLENVLTERGVKTYQYRLAETGFMASGMLITFGEFEDDDEEEEYDEGLKEYQGADNSHKIMSVNAKTPETAPKWVSFEDDQKDKKYDATSDKMMYGIIRAYNQLPMLHGISTGSSLGSIKNEIEETKNLYDNEVKDERNACGKFAAKVLKNWHEGDPDPKGEYEVVPITGLAPKVEKKPLAERLGVGGMQSLTASLPQPGIVLDEPAKKRLINLLRVAFSLTFVEADAIVNGTDLPPDESENGPN